jgi:Cdc6-like AAA superfamily ATPase
MWTDLCTAWQENIPKVQEFFRKLTYADLPNAHCTPLARFWKKSAVTEDSIVSETKVYRVETKTLPTFTRDLQWRTGQLQLEPLMQVTYETDNLEQILQLIDQYPGALITGSPGVGKTFVMKAIAEHLKEQGKVCEDAGISLM